MARLDNRVALLTGGAKGIGGHYARALVREGARLMIADIAGASDLVEAIAGEHGVNSVASAITDVSDEDAVKRLVAETVERFGKIDILVNNAALFAPLAEQKVTDIDTAIWDRVMAVNVRGVFLMTKHVAPHMMAQNYGKIINISSGTVARGIPLFAHYVSSKGAVTAFTRAVSRELGEYKICVNSLAPGFTLSETVVDENPGHIEHSRAPSIARRAIKRDEYPEDLLGALIFLASPDSDFITGQTIAVDGGANNT
jgi:NAD(P)-dependent dehydrogenase (short-subunit alcohol dehydrogenase family)